MKKTEIYIYYRKELEENLVILNENKKNDILYLTENTLGNIYLPNSDINVGKINFINNLIISKENSFNTSIGTIITNNGSIVFNFNYILKFLNSSPEIAKVLSANPTFVSGNYLNYKNIKITIQVLDMTSERIIAIEYE